MTKKLADHSKEELLEYIKNISRQKKFGLIWEHKSENVVEQCQTELPVLKEITEKNIQKAEDSPTNLIIEGDNYHSLSALNYTHAKKIDVIYIDPPYNTGSNDFIYNDKYVEKEDTFRHSKWLSFMSRRLELSKQLLKDDGVIFISIDDNEFAQLRMLCNEVFGEEKFVGVITWEKRTKSQNTKTAREMLQLKTEYILVYKNGTDKARFNLDISGEKVYDLQDDKGVYRLSRMDEMSATGMRGRKTMIYEIHGINPRPTKQWQLGKEQVDIYDARGDVEVMDGKVYIRMRPEDESNMKFIPFWSHFFDKDTYGTAETGKAELKEIFDGDHMGFETVKPINLIKKLFFHINKGKNETVLDFFAGTGTTGHAIMKLNQEDGGNRKFILCTNNENGIAENLTYERIKRATAGYSDKKAIPTNVRYFKTDFVSKDKTDDQTRLALVGRCTDLIRVRESTFDFAVDEDDFKLLGGTNHNAAIIFDPHKISDYFKRIEDLDDSKPVNVYIFSYSNYAYEDDVPETNLHYTLCPIPESVLEVYRRIFKEEKNV